MTKEQLVYLRELMQRDDGTGHHMSGQTFVVFDGGVSYEMNNISPKSSRHMVIWDDSQEIVSCCAINNDFYTQAQQPVKIMNGVYANIHYMEGTFSMKNFEKVVEDNFSSLLTEDQKKILLEWAENIRNSVQQPRALPYYDNEINIVPHKNQAIERDDTILNSDTFGKGSVKTASASTLAETLKSVGDGAGIMISGDVDTPITVGKNVRLVFSSGTKITDKLEVPAGTKRVDIESGTFTGATGGSEEPKTKGVYMIANNANIDNIRKITVSANEEGTHWYNALKVTGSEVLIEDCVFDSTVPDKIYNCIEGDWDKKIKKLIVRNCKFTGCKWTNNAISVFAFEDNATVEIENCVFDYSANAVRLTNRLKAKNVTVTIKNCRYKSTTNDEYAGFLLLQADGGEDFSDMKINFINLVGPDGKVVTENKSDGKQVWYTYNTETKPVVSYR